MKNSKIVKILGSAVLIASLGITGCSVNVAAETSEETTKETTKETTEKETEEEDPCCCVVEDDDEVFYCSCPFQSTNGELEGQMDYMVLFPDDDTWNSLPDLDEDGWAITDLSVIEDEDIRNLAQSYQDEGYLINDPAIDQAYGFAWGDGEYMFSNGFTAYNDTGRIYSYVNAYKMNETLFYYFMVEWNGLDDSSVPLTDDGTVIRYGEDDYYAEFNRDTGIGIIYSSFDSSQGLGL